MMEKQIPGLLTMPIIGFCSISDRVSLRRATGGSGTGKYFLNGRRRVDSDTEGARERERGTESQRESEREKDRERERDRGNGDGAKETGTRRLRTYTRIARGMRGAGK